MSRLYHSVCNLICGVLIFLRFPTGYSDTAFLATIDAGTISPVPNPIVFNETRYNDGGHYDTETGIYTVPLDGMYMISTTLRSQPDNDYMVRIVVDGSLIADSRNSDGTRAGYMAATASVPLHLTTGQQVWVSPNNLDATYGSTNTLMYTWFSAYLISAD